VINLYIYNIIYASTGILITIVLLYCLRFFGPSHYPESETQLMFHVHVNIMHILYIHIIFREIRNALTKEKRKTGMSVPKLYYYIL